MGPVCDALRKAQCDAKLGPLTVARVWEPHRNSLCCFAENTVRCKAETVNRGMCPGNTRNPLCRAAAITMRCQLKSLIIGRVREHFGSSLCYIVEHKYGAN
jgi:hypothetical protein